VRVNSIRFFSLLVVSLLLPFLVQAEGEHGHVRLSAIDDEMTHGAAIEILRKVYHRVGYTVDIELLPAKRSLEQANLGNTDGDVARIAGTENSFPNLRPIPTPILTFKGVAFTKIKGERIDAWNDLAGYSVGIIRGIRYSEAGTRGLNRYFVKDMAQLFKVLNNGRVQFVVAGASAGGWFVKENHADSGIHRAGGALHEAPLYHFIHKKNAHLVSQLDETIKKMEESGELEAIFSGFFE